jgi:hypothetical protein
MGGFGSGRYGARPTAEATASFVFNISSLRSLIKEGQRLTAIALFDEGKFPVSIRLDNSNWLNAFVELTHRTRDDIGKATVKLSIASR